jgi:hypothetical protein
MDLTAFLQSLAASALATRIRDSLLLFPLLESIHVIGLGLVFGTILVIDLRLLGLASTNRPFQRVAADIMKWTWAAFALTAVTGSLMFLTNAPVYFHNSYFRVKMLLLVLAGLNMFVFERTDGKNVEAWGNSVSAPRGGRRAAVLSIVLWIAIIAVGRLIGFTTSRATLGKPPAQVDFDDFLKGASDKGAPPK